MEKGKSTMLAIPQVWLNTDRLMSIRKWRILLADDERSVQLTLKAVFEIHGYDVHSVGSALEAILALNAGEYDLVLTDMKMEEATAGKDVIRVARELPYRPAF